ncbi:unnamed protein product [Symbiodinium necroappetens]|uniref:SMODS and SLOG-associating 2TM effector domain-containing protein n=1 Tax=Symbiodinium necroappetens TaxID=1628268 RepID=A0A812SUG0_9DINO|nr:unnamed protein product [Symbiodinium necroappetens]
MSVFAYDYEKLQVMKAKTMYVMVEDLDLGQGPMKLLFLTNSQADSISSSSQTLQKMLQALEIPTPKLVINLLNSWGLRASLNLFPASKYNLRMNPGIFYDSPPFLRPNDELESMEKFDMFMSDVILPLAASTNAVILANAIPGDCALAGALARSYRLHRATWGSPPPFTILSLAGSTPRLYLNPDQGAYWRSLCRKSKSWTARDPFILETIQTHGYFRSKLGQCDCTHDIDPDTRYLFLVDSVKTNGEGFTTNPSQSLRTELVRFLASTLPSFVMKTGHAEKFANDEKTFQACLDQANAGVEVLLLDLRKRPEIGLTSEASLSRAQYIEAAWRSFENICDELRTHNLCDSLDACSVAYAHQFLFGSMEEGGPRSRMKRKERAIPLHEAIRLAREDRFNHRVSPETDTGAQLASDAQVMDIAQQLARRTYQDCFDLLPQLEQTDANRDYYFHKKAGQLTSCIRALLLNPKLRSVNIHNLDDARRTVNQMVQSDSLPKKNSLEGLLLLQQAWDEVDIANHLAWQYKVFCKFLYLTQLLLAWLVILASQVDKAWLDISFSDTVFILAILGGAAVSIEGIFTPKPKWQALRCGNLSLVSIIWRYRTRVGQFRLAPGVDPRQPELALCKLLNDWAEDLMSSADLKRSVWSKNFPAYVYRHQQCSGSLGSSQGSSALHERVAVDDHFSPVQPDLYIQFRMLERKSWYQQRIPTYSNHVFAFKLLILVCTVACSVLARFEQPVALVVVTASASAATTWAEFVGAGSKVERYTRAVRSITCLLNWWKNLSEVEKASTENISRLVLETEQIVGDEKLGGALGNLLTSRMNLDINPKP